MRERRGRYAGLSDGRQSCGAETSRKDAFASSAPGRHTFLFISGSRCGRLRDMYPPGNDHPAIRPLFADAGGQLAMRLFQGSITYLALQILWLLWRWWKAHKTGQQVP